MHKCCITGVGDEIVPMELRLQIMLNLLKKKKKA